MPQKSNPTPTTGGRREALRRQQEAAAKAARRTGIAVKAAWITGLAVIALMIGVTVFAITRPGSAGVAAGTLVAPQNSTADGAVVIGKPDAPVSVAIWADFMCPYCGDFERANGADLSALVEAGTAKLEVHPMSFLDQQSAGSRFSTRTANAFVAVADQDPARAWEFSRLIYDNQPHEGTAGLTDAQLADLARQAGVPDDVIATFADETWVPWIQQLTDASWDSGITGTPTVKINGTPFGGDIFTAGPLAAAITEAARG